MFKKILLVGLCLIFVSACAQVTDSVDDGETASEIEAVEEMPEDYVGVWSRQATYSGGQLVSTAPATLTLKNNSYVSSAATCSVNGGIEVTEDQMTMSVDSHNCPGPAPAAVTHTYSIIEDENDQETMTFVVMYMGVEVKEIYKRTE